MSDVPVLEGELIDSPSDSFRPVPEAFRNSPSGGQLAVPQPQGGFSGQNYPGGLDSFGNRNPFAYTRDPNIPNYTGVSDRDWTPEVDDINRAIADDIADVPGLIDPPRGTAAAAGGILGRLNPIIGPALGYAEVAGTLEELTGGAFQAEANPFNSGIGQRLADRFFGRQEDYTPQQGNGPPPFEGGQSNVDYIVTWRIQNFQNVITVQRTIRGPIQGPSIEFTQQGPCTKFGRPANRYQLRTRIYARGSVAYDNLNYSGNCFRDSEFAAQQENIYTISFTVVRADGQPDTGGDPLGDPVPTGRPGQGEGEPDFSNPNQPGVPGIGLPNPSVPNLPGIGNPFGDSPITGDGFDGIDAPNPLLPGVPGFPGFDPDGESGDDTSGDGSDPTGEPGENLTCCEKIDAIHNYFQKSGSEQYDSAPCDDGPLYDAWEGTGLVGLYRAVEALTRAVGLIWERLRCMESGAVAIPEWWAVRPGSAVPQLAITLWEADSDPPSTWSLTIPHYIKGKDHILLFPKFRKGSYFSTLTLLDNTKLVVNAISFDEGERVINALVPVIDPAFLPQPIDIHQGRRRGVALSKKQVIAARAAFYPEGQQSPVPEFYAEIKTV